MIVDDFLPRHKLPSSARFERWKNIIVVFFSCILIFCLVPSRQSDPMILAVESLAEVPSDINETAGSNELVQGSVTLETGFDSDWKRQSIGTQIIFLSPDNKSVCQSAIINDDDYRKLIGKYGNAERAQQERVQELLRKQFEDPQLEDPQFLDAMVYINIQKFLSDTGPSSRDGLKIDIKQVAPTGTRDQFQLVVWARNESHTASLTCFQQEPTPNGPADLEEIARKYRIKN